MSFAPANLQWVGVARETTPGTAEATPTLWVPVDTPQYHVTIPPLKDTGLRGSMAMEYQQIGGQWFASLSFKTNCYLDSVFFLLRTLLGYPDQVTGSEDPYTHQTALLSSSGGGATNGQPISSTVFWTDAQGKTQQMRAAQASTVKVTINAEQLVTLEVTYIGFKGTAIDPPTNTPTTALPMPSWNTIVNIGGSPNTAFSELSIEYKRATEVIPAITGTQDPYAIFAGPVSGSGSLTAIYQGVTDVNWVDYLANTQPVLSYKIAPVGDATHYIQGVSSKVAYDDVTVSGTNKWMELKATVTLLANPTDAIGGGFSQAHVTLLSAVSTAI